MKNFLRVSLLTCLMLICIAVCSACGGDESDVTTSSTSAATTTANTATAPATTTTALVTTTTAAPIPPAQPASKGLDFELSDDETYYLVCGIGSCTDTEIVIPAMHEGKPVLSIDTNAFCECEDIVSVIVPEGITSIGISAFEGCTALETVTLPDSLIFVEEDAFYDCALLHFNEYGNAFYFGNERNPYVLLVRAKSEEIVTAEVHAKTKLISPYAFEDCSDLVSIELSNVVYIGEGAFDSCASLERIVIPDSVTVIADTAFYRCAALEQVVLSDNLTSIGYMAFKDCIALKGIEIPEGVTVIDGYAFEGCTSLASITIPESVVYIASYALARCTSLQYNEYDNALYLGNATNPYRVLVKAKSEEITSVTIHENTVAIYMGAFLRCSRLESVTIPQGTEFIGWLAFNGCSSLSSVTLENPVGWCKSDEYFSNWEPISPDLLNDPSELAAHMGTWSSESLAGHELARNGSLK